MAWKVELSAGAERELIKLDEEHRRRILKFLVEWVSALDDPRSIREPRCKVLGLASSGNIGSASFG
jgi:mRNA-degrading endonuclease RelE of RelBE toxin-antitoxin system